LTDTTPISDHFVAVEGIRLHWAELGSASQAPPLLLLHGLNNSCLSWSRVLSLSPLLRCVTRRRPMRVARVLTQLLGELRQSLFQLSDAPILIRDARGLLGDARILRRELRFEFGDPIVSPIALHDHPMIELRPDGKTLRIYGAK
jgi:hypothetical protein